MKNLDYTAKVDDTLLKIAVEQGVNYADLLILNPNFQAAPKNAFAGKKVLLSAEESPLEQIVLNPYLAPINATINTNAEGCISTPNFVISDILMVTGDKPENYYFVDKRAQDEILKEADFLNELAKEYKTLFKPQHTVGSPLDSKLLITHQLNKERWFKKACYAGLFEVNDKVVKADPVSPPNSEYIQSEIQTLEQRRSLLKNYHEIFKQEGSHLNCTEIEISSEKLDELLSLKLTSLETLQETSDASIKVSAAASSADVATEEIAVSNSMDEFGFTEVLLVSENRLLYLRKDFIAARKKQWKTQPSQLFREALDKKSNLEILSKALFNDINKSRYANDSAVEIDALSKSWTINNAADFKFREWIISEKFTGLNSSFFSTRREAQLLRFCANKNNIIDVIEANKIDLNISSNLDTSLLEGSVSIKDYFPNEAGKPVLVAYTDANGVVAYHPFGYFRSFLNIELNCFSKEGVEQSKMSGIDAIVSPQIELGIHSSKPGVIGVKGESLIGGTSGGHVEGFLELKLAYFNTDDFMTLVHLESKKSVELDIEFLGGFQLVLIKNQFVFYCKSNLFFEGNGGFGVPFDSDHLWVFSKFMLGVLRAADYRHIHCVDPVAFDYFSKAAYYLFASEVADLKTAVNSGSEHISLWWNNRNNNLPSKGAEAQSIVNKILSREDIYNGLPLNILPPETIGMLLDTLISTLSYSLERSQEIAVNYLLRKYVRKSWRKLEEVVTHMHPSGEKNVDENSFYIGLNRINNILDKGQLIDFNKWVNWVAEESGDIDEENSPFKFTSDQKTFENKLLARNLL